MTIGSLFSGYGGLDRAVEHVFGGRTIWHSEINPAASKVLDNRWPCTPNLGDITLVDWSIVEPVDVIAAGWPCQPFSLAGKRKGSADERALWPYVARAVRMVRPRYVVLENVSAIVTAGELARALADLAALGYVGSWRCLRASDVGAPHRRERCFIVAADAAGDGRHERRPESAGQLGRPDAAERGTTAADTDQPGSQGPQPARRRHLPDGCTAADADRDTVREQPESEPWRGSEAVAGLARTDAAADTHSDGLQGVGWLEHVGRDADRRRGPDIAWGPYEPAIRRWERVLGRVAPAPTEPGRNGPRLAPRFVEWMMGLPAGWVTDVPGITRNDQLRMLGNGVVPQQAIAALEHLLAADKAVA